MEEALTQSGHWLDVKSEEFERMQYYLKVQSSILLWFFND
jgi:hypothetical protein